MSILVTEPLESKSTLNDFEVRRICFILLCNKRFTKELKSNEINKGPVELLHVTGTDGAAT